LAQIRTNLQDASSLGLDNRLHIWYRFMLRSSDRFSSELKISACVCVTGETRGWPMGVE